MTTNDWQAPGAGSAGAGDRSATTTGPEDGGSRPAAPPTSPYAAPGSDASAAGTTSPYAQPAGEGHAYQAPYGQPAAQAPYGQAPAQAPYSQPAYPPAPYGQAPYAQAPYGQAPYGQAPSSQAPYGQAPSSQAPYGQPGYPTAGGYAQPYPAYGPPPGWAPAPKNDGMAIASLVTGIGGLVTLLVILGPVALGLGIAGLRRVARDGTVGRGMAWTGIVTGALQTLILLGIIVLIVLGVNGVFDDPYAYDSAY